MADDSKRETIKITASISGIIVIAGILISIGQILEDIEHQRTSDAEIRMEIAEIRVQLSRHINTAAHRDAAKDLQYLQRRLDRLENEVQKMENGR